MLNLINKHNPISDNSLNCLLNEYIDDFLNKKSLSFVVKESIPIVWFGDIDSYMKSNTRVLTIGLNPSKEEFPEHNPRFDITLKIPMLYATLNEYFKRNPYTRWFLQYNELLSAFDCSFGGSFGNKSNTALHIDIYSAIATDPTWGGLSESEKIALTNSDLFDKLLTLLAPDIILVSVNKQVFFEHFGDWDYCTEEIFSNGTYIRLFKKDDKKLFWGRNVQGTPFGGVTRDSAINTIKKMLCFQ